MLLAIQVSHESLAWDHASDVDTVKGISKNSIGWIFSG